MGSGLPFSAVYPLHPQLIRTILAREGAATGCDKAVQELGIPPMKGLVAKMPHKITCGVIGAGRIGRMQINNLLTRIPEARLKTVAVDQARRVQELAARAGHPASDHGLP